MTRTELLIMLKTYVSEVNRATILRKPVPQPTRDRLAKMGAAIVQATEQWTPSMRAARKVRTDKATERRQAEPFTLTWHTSGDVETILGWQAMADRLGISAGTLRTAISKGRGTMHRQLFCEHSGWDTAEIRRVHWRAGGQGRPRKQTDDLA